MSNEVECIDAQRRSVVGEWLTPVVWGLPHVRRVRHEGAAAAGQWSDR